MSKKDIKDHILVEAMEILKNEGSSGVTMRKVASSCNISLSNLQYHYTNKTILLQALSAKFFAHCSENLLNEWEVISAEKDLSTEQFIRKLVEFLIGDDEIGIDYYLYREIWALSLRDPELSIAVKDFYSNYARLIAELIGQVKQSSTEEIASLLVPFMEGYSIVRKAMPSDAKQMTETLVRIIVAL
ncbi:hypothetical protein IQ37_18605 [Chryseobacterium piperi]|uniref:HTH tetR-type domain-containing protein n=1 Tax=Chryseobacterium piperi TaxID=558152 RepID=A0A086AFL9_9FLAO|nr:TetR/AcrR family transcriptional regulator [Chryseobacterium piperi]ASW75251.1 TetR/AcrR family transcriptional regulator [Chryseobacterium piperi]KFF15483.1 hypothetical protein IQ37_18605 [Chryseobacterium piperi]